MQLKKLVAILLVAVLSIGGVNWGVNWMYSGQANAALETHLTDYRKHELECKSKQAQFESYLEYRERQADKDRDAYKESLGEIKVVVKDLEIGLMNRMDDLDRNNTSDHKAINESLFRHLGENK